MKQIYVIGSLRNPMIPLVATALRGASYTVFDDWHCAGPEADDYWKSYEEAKGNTYLQALEGAAANNVFNFDKRNLDASDAAVMVLPAGRSAHLELGYMAGCGKPTFIMYTEDPDRWDIMYKFADHVCIGLENLVDKVKLFVRRNDRLSNCIQD